MQSSANVVRFPVRLRRVDLDALRRLEQIEESPVARGHIGPDGGLQVQLHNGEVYSLEAARAARRRQSDHDPLPPAGAMALAA